MHPAAERLPGEAVRLVLPAVLGEALGVEDLRVRPVLGHVVRVQRHHRGEPAGRDLHAQDLGVLDGLAGEHRHRRVQSKRLLHHQRQVRQSLELGQGGVGAQIQALPSQPVLPLHVAAELVDHRGHGAGGGVVRGHEQEDHLVDDVVVVDPPGRVGHLAQRGEQVLARVRAAGREMAAQELLQQSAPPGGAAPLGERHRRAGADVSVGGLDAVDEGGVDAVELAGCGVLGAAHEHLGGQVQGVRLEGGVDLEGPVRGPGGDPGVDQRRERARVALEPGAGERLLHEVSVVAVLVEVEQHQPAVEERPHQVTPPGAAGEGLVAVLQRGLAGVGADEGGPRGAEETQVGDGAVVAVAPGHGRERIMDVLEGSAEDRQLGAERGGRGSEDPVARVTWD